MDHNKVIKTLEALIPQGAKLGPENVIVKYASENNLAPAQLEKIAQMYNVAMTINFMNKAASRGDTFQLIDTESLMAKYTNPAPASKSAHVPSEWSAWLEPEPMNKAASDADSYGMPDIIGMAKGHNTTGFVVEQTDKGYPAASLDSMWESFRKEAFDKYEVDSVHQLILEAEDEYRDAANSLRDLVQIKGASFKEISSDTMRVCGNGMHNTLTKLASYLVTTRCAGIEVANPDTITKSKIVRDQWNAVAVVEKAAAALDKIKAAKSYMDFFEKEATRFPKKNKPSGGTTVTSLQDIPDDEDDGGADNDDGADNVPAKKKNLTEGAKLTDEPESFSDDDDVGMSKYDKDIYMAKKDNGGKGKGDGGKPQGQGMDLASLGGGALSAGKEMLSPDNYFGGVNNFDTYLKSVMPNKANTSQRHVDTAVSEAANVTTLQRLLITDPIISEADPNTVVSLYNTLQRANPEIASDPNVLRFALREAIQYDAIPMHTYKDFVETDQKRQQADKDRNEVNNNRYRL